MLIRCAARTVGGMMLVSGLVAGAALTAGTIGAVLVGKRLWEERKGWREGSTADSAAADPAGDAAMDAPVI